ncbi:hypothetical protein ACJJI3_19395 [Microbulbifer sp. ZKSA004]|uniref:hypothetical protein n=1 Tax=Microbulbifer sp. ZKSA004 TaxID=3243389 RepID=UPI00403948B9
MINPKPNEYKQVAAFRPIIEALYFMMRIPLLFSFLLYSSLALSCGDDDLLSYLEFEPSKLSGEESLLHVKLSVPLVWKHMNLAGATFVSPSAKIALKNAGEDTGFRSYKLSGSKDFLEKSKFVVFYEPHIRVERNKDGNGHRVSMGPLCEISFDVLLQI